MQNLLARQFKISSLNIEYLVNKLNKEGVEIFNLKKCDKNHIYITIDCKDVDKFFAICKKMCYNIEYKGYKGYLWFLPMLSKNIGKVVGVLLFIIMQIYLNGLMVGVEFLQDGKDYVKEVEAVLDANGIEKWDKFNLMDMQLLYNSIMLSNKNIEFVKVQKRGNYLSIEIKSSPADIKGVDKSCTNLYSTQIGTVLGMSVLRGTEQVKIGDRVEQGQLLVGGYYNVGEQVLQTYVLASVSLAVGYEYRYESVSIDENYIVRAKTLALEQLAEENILKVEYMIASEVATESGKYIIDVFVTYEKIMLAG